MRRVNVLDAGEVSEASSRQLTVFYTGLYRALTFPRRLDEIDERGRRVHYSPYSSTGGTFEGPLVTDNGFWDTYRTVYPLLALVYPDHLGVLVQGNRSRRLIIGPPSCLPPRLSLLLSKFNPLISTYTY